MIFRGIARTTILVAAVAAIAATAHAQLPIVDGFEYDAYTTGSLPQGDWNSDSPTSAQVQQSVAYEGQASLKVLGGASVSRGYSISDQIVYVEGFYRGTPSSELPDVSVMTSGSAIVGFHGSMGIVCLDGDGAGSGTWTQTSVTSIDPSSWYSVLIRLDFGASPPSYDLWINNQPEVSGMGFLYDSTTALNGFVASSGYAASYLDYLTVSATDPTPEPTSLAAPDPIHHYGFEDTNMGWISAPIIPADEPATFSVTDSSLDIWATARETFAFWGNSALIPLAADSLFEGRWRVSSDVTAPLTDAPSFRMRVNTSTLDYNNGLNIVSSEDSAYSPDADGRTYKQFFLPPDTAADESIILSFDLVHFSPLTPPDTAIHLDSVTVLRHDVDQFDPSFGTEVASYDFSGGDPGDWVAAQIPIFDIPTYTTGGVGLGITSASNDNCFGFWGSPFIGPIGAGDQLVRVDFDATAQVSDPMMAPELRLRVNWDNFQAGLENGMLSVTSGEHSPTGTARTYSVFVHMPGDVTGIDQRTLLLSFDLINLSGVDQADATFTLNRCDVTAFDL